MRMLRNRFAAGAIFLLFSLFCSAQKKVVVLGSSTAAGSGASSYANSWVGKYAAYITGFGHSLTNLAVGGYNTYNILSTGTPHPGRPGQDPVRNVTAAVTNHDADVVIVNMPSNDVANSYDVSETLLNYRRIRAYCDSAGVAVYFTTTQPRNFTDAGKLGQLMQIRDSTFVQHGAFAIDFWNSIANADGTINSAYNTDGVHVNDAAHEIFFQRVKAKQIAGLITVLPISIKNFRALPTSLGVQLSWELHVTGASQSRQEVQRSEDGVLFYSSGNLLSSVAETYTFIDAKPITGVCYYRLKLLHGSSVKYSDVLQVLPGSGKSGVTVSPNPIVGRTLRMQVLLEDDREGLLIVSNASGAEVFRQRLAEKKGVTVHSLQLPANLPAGIYYIRTTAVTTRSQLSVLLQ